MWSLKKALLLCALLSGECEGMPAAHPLRFESSLSLSAPDERVLSDDADNDGRLDLVFVPPFAPWHTWLGDGQGGLALHDVFDVHPGAGFVDEHLVDGDDRQRPGSFVPSRSFVLANDAVLLSSTDLDGYAHADFIALSRTQSTAPSWRQGDGRGHFLDAQSFVTGVAVIDFASGDFYEDGPLDLATAGLDTAQLLLQRF